MIFKLFAKTEICKFDVSGFEKNIIGFDITMKYIDLVECFESIKKLFEYP